MNNKQLKNNKGFTLLFSALVGALVIAVGLAILEITLKQLTLSAAGRESQQAFYSADAGTECALYLDRGAGFTDCRLGFFGTPSTTAGIMEVCGVNAVGAPHVQGSGDDVQCFGRQIDIIRNLSGNGQSVVNTFSLQEPFTLSNSEGDNQDMCFNVTVIKTIDTAITASASGTTIIESRGYNTCNADTANRFERAIRTVNN